MSPMKLPAAWQDRPQGFGWLSIVLHWVTALAFFTLWLMGKGIGMGPPEQAAERRALHVIVGLSLWLVLAGRIAWRVRQGHPRARGLSDQTHQLARRAHYGMLGLLSVMLLSGPVLAASLARWPQVADIAHSFHATAANLLALLVAVHIGAALKHLMFHDDDSVARICVPPSFTVTAAAATASTGADIGNQSAEQQDPEPGRQ